MKLKIWVENKILKVTLRQNILCLLWDIQFLLLATKNWKNIINKSAEQTGKNCIFTLLSKLYSIFSLRKNYIIYFICKYLFMDLKQYLSISLLRDKALSYLVLLREKFINEKSK